METVKNEEEQGNVFRANVSTSGLFLLVFFFSFQTLELKGRPVVMPYAHALPHGLKKVARRHEMPLAFSAPNKLQKLCPRICFENEQGCSIKRTDPLNCSIGVVCFNPVSCGKAYIGQTERFITDPLREHALKANKKEDKYTHLVACISACGCEPKFCENKILCGSKSCSSKLA